MTRSAGAIVVSAVALRWLFCFWLFPAVLAQRSTIGKIYYLDSYREIAASVISGNGYRLGEDQPPALHRPPGYLAVILLCDPRDSETCFVWLHLLQGLLGGAAAWLTLRAARAWNVPPGGALFSGWIVALWPFAIWETKVSVPENLLLALIPAVFLLLARIPRSLAHAVFTGAVGGGVALTHGLYQALFLPLVISPFCFKMPRRRKIAASALLAVSFAAALAPWLLRNSRLGYRGIATGFGFHALMGNADFVALIHGRPFFRRDDLATTASVTSLLRSKGYSGIDTDAERSDPRINRYLDRLAVEHMRTHPLSALAKVVVMMPLSWVAEQTPARTVLNALILAPLFLLAILGLAGRRELFPLAFAIFVLNAATALVFSWGMPMRYTLPLMPLLSILAGAGLSGLPKS